MKRKGEREIRERRGEREEEREVSRDVREEG